MACEERILRVLRTLEYPGLDEVPGNESTSSTLGLTARPHDLAKIVSWIEDRKVRRGVGGMGIAEQLLLSQVLSSNGVFEIQVSDS